MSIALPAPYKTPKPFGVSAEEARAIEEAVASAVKSAVGKTGYDKTTNAGTLPSPYQYLDWFGGPTHGLFSLSGPLDQNVIFWLILFKLSKTHPTLVHDILKTTIVQSAGILSDYVRAGAGNEIAAWGSGRLASQWMERFGMITQEQAGDFIRGMNTLTGISVVEGAFGVVTELIHGKQEPAYPNTLHLGDKILVREKEPRYKEAVTLARAGKEE